MHVMLTDCYKSYVDSLSSYSDADNSYLLFKSFLDGMFDEWGEESARCGNTDLGRIILTSEILYADRNTSHVVRYGVAPLINNYDAFVPPIDTRYGGGSQYFNEVDDIGLALWIDHTSFDPATPNSNYWTPQVFKDVLGTIIDNCDWAWIYNPTYSFYHSSGTNLIPAAYLDKLRDLRVEKGLL
jgi:hypothetical protein